MSEQQQRQPAKEKTEKEKLIDNIEKLITYVPIWNQEAVKNTVAEIKENLQKI
jgi:hypothetical protein